MSRRGHRLVGLGLGFVCLILVVAGFMTKSPRADVALTWVGFTNVPISVNSWSRSAVFAITNCGAVPVKLARLWEAYTNWNLVLPIPVREDCGGTNLVTFRSYPLRLPDVLQPGESVEIESYICSGLFRGEVAYTRLGLPQRLAQRVRNSTNLIVRAAAKLLSTSSELQWARSDLIQPEPVRRFHITAPPLPVSRFHISAPPPPLQLDMPFEVR